MPPGSDRARVSIVIVNWNGWADTVECLESVFRLDYADFRVIVCDNGSEDGSPLRIAAWAEGRLDVVVPVHHPLRRLSFPPVGKPVRYREYDRDTAERGGDPLGGDVPLVLIRTGANLGFAGGVNVALRYVRARRDSSYVWLLNNDTVVDGGALRAVVRRAAAGEDVGMCGSTLCDYDRPGMIQALGGARYNRWLAVGRCIGEGRTLEDAIPAERVERSMSYVVGAAMLVSSSFLSVIGLMREEYFLYFEEVDWAVRGRRRFALGYAADSRVYHKGGASTQAGWRSGRATAVADYFNVRGRLLVTRTHFPLMLPSVYLGLVVSFLIRLWRGRFDRLPMILKLALTCGRAPIIDVPRARGSGGGEDQPPRASTSA